MTMHDEGCGIYIVGRTEAEVREAGAKLRERLGKPDLVHPESEAKPKPEGPSPSILERLTQALRWAPADRRSLERW